jgi:hypothetical protein
MAIDMHAIQELVVLLATLQRTKCYNFVTSIPQAERLFFNAKIRRDRYVLDES